MLIETLLILTSMAHAIVSPDFRVDARGHRAATAEVRMGAAGLEQPPLDATRIARVPHLEQAASERVSGLWDKAKRIADPVEQLRFVAKKKLRALIANDLVPFTRLAGAFGRNLRRRDFYRERIWARPELVAVVERASELLAERVPGATITVGDIAQAGGGQIPFGTRVDVLRDTPLRAPVRDFIERALPRFERLVLVEQVDPREAFIGEQSRFAEMDEPVLVERALTGIDARDPYELAGRFETRRFWRDEPMTGRPLSRFWSGVKRSMRKGQLVERAATKTADGTLYRGVWVDGRVLVEVFARRKPSKGLRLSDLVEVRRSRIDPSKPGVPVRETRYVPEGTPGARIAVWQALYEATHVSHMGGLDADLSYVADDVRYHFTREIGQYDMADSRAWLVALYDASLELGVGIDRMFIDPRLRRQLRASATKEELGHPMWDLVGASRGHDSHVHVRLLPSDAPVAKATGSSPAGGAATPFDEPLAHD